MKTEIWLACASWPAAGNWGRHPHPLFSQMPQWKSRRRTDAKDFASLMSFRDLIERITGMIPVWKRMESVLRIKREHLEAENLVGFNASMPRKIEAGEVQR
jgi:hypothetical protein